MADPANNAVSPTGQDPSLPKGFTSDAAPVPAPTPAPPPPNASGYGDSAAAVAGSAVTPPPQPEYNNHGYYVPTKEDIGKFDQAVAAGLPLDQIDPRFKASIYVAKGGDPLQSYDAAKTLILDPARDARDKESAEANQQITTNPLGFAASSIGVALKATGQVGQGVWQTGGDVLNWAAKNVSEGEQAIQSGGNALGSLLEHKPGQAAADWDQLNQHMRNAAALNVDSAAKGVNDATNLVTMAGAFLPHMAADLVRSIPGIPDDIKARAIQRDDQLTYGVLKFQKQMNDWTDGFSGKLTQNLANVGAITQAQADMVKASEAKNTPSQVQGGGTVLNPINWIGPATALHGAGLATKPAFGAAIEESGQKLANLQAEQATILSKLGNAQDRLANWKPVNPGDGAPMPSTPPELTKGINDLQGYLDQNKQAIASATQDHQVQITQAANQIQTSAGMASRIAGGLAQKTGQSISKIADAGSWFNQRADEIALKLSDGNPQMAELAKKAAFGGLGSIVGRFMGGEGIEGTGVGLAASYTGKALKLVGATPSQIGYGISVLGKEFLAGEASSPFWRRVADQTTGFPQWVAKGLDNSFVNDVTRTASGAINAGFEAGAVNAGIAGIGSWGNPQAVGQGFISGGILGMAGGIVKTWRDYGSPDQVAAAQVGDRYRFLQSLDSDTAQQFKKLTPEAQLTMGSYFGQHPDLGLKFDAPEGGGSHYLVNGNAKDGYSATIHVDPSQPETAVLAQVAHEFNHHLEQRGMAGELNARLLGDPNAGTPGLFTKVDSAGNPVKRVDGSYDTNDEFGQLRDRLAARYAAQGQPNEILTDQRVVRELASESAVARVAPGSVVPRASLADKYLDAGTSPFVTKNFVKTALASLGNGFDPTNHIVGTGLFTGEKRIPAVDSILKEWYEGRRQQSPLDSGDPTFVTTKDLIGKSDVQIRSLSGAVDAFATGKDGRLLRRSDNSPILKTTSQLEAPGNAAGKEIHAKISGMDPQKREAAGILPDGEGGYHITDVAKAQSLLAQHLRPQQMDVLNSMQGIMDGAPGGGVRMRYHPVYRRGPWKQPIADSLPIKDVSAMPLFTRVTQKGNLLVHALDHGQLLENATAAVKKGNGSEWGYKPAAIVEGARTMLEALAKDQPSTSVVTPSQKRFLYELTGLDPKVNGADVFSDISRKARSESIYKTYRVDRIHSATVDGTHNWKLQSDIHEAIKGYRSGNKSFSEELGERVKAAGVRFGEKVFTGPTHAQAWDEAERQNALPTEGDRSGETGFVTSSGRFISKQEAWKLQHNQDRGNLTPQLDSSELPGYAKRYENQNQSLRSGSQKFTSVTIAQRAQINGPETARSGVAASLASQAGPAAFRQQLGQAAKERVQEVVEPAVQAARPAFSSQVPRAQPVQPVQTPRAAPVDAGRQLTNVPERNVRIDALPKASNRLEMARNIMSMETDLRNGLRVEQLPPGDRSGPGYEVAGITPKWDGPMASRLAHMIQSGNQKQAMSEAEHYIANLTDSVYKYAPKQVLEKHPETEFYLRDIAFHQGEGAVKRILARSLGMGPQYLNSETAAAGIKGTPNLLESLKQNRQLYVQLVQHPAANLYRGVMNRTNLAQQKAMAFR